MEEGVARAAALAACGLDAVEVSYGVMRSYLANIRPYVGLTSPAPCRTGCCPGCGPGRRPGLLPPIRSGGKAVAQVPVILVGGLRTTGAMAEPAVGRRGPARLRPHLRARARVPNAAAGRAAPAPSTASPATSASPMSRLRSVEMLRAKRRRSRLSRLLPVLARPRGTPAICQTVLRSHEVSTRGASGCAPSGSTTRAPFGDGPEATRAAVEHLGYVQIDTINVIERCHHHILYTRIPAYRRDASAPGAERRQDRVRILDARAVLRADRGTCGSSSRAMKRASARAAALVRRGDARRSAQGAEPHPEDGALTIRDIDDDVLVEKDHAGRAASRRSARCSSPSTSGVLTDQPSATGMLKTYELMDRHFGWDTRAEAGHRSEQILGLPARPRAARAGRREPRFDLPPRRAAQAGDPAS